MVLALLIIYLINRELGTKAFVITMDSILEMIAILPPIFILLGFGCMVPKETMIRYLGEHSVFAGVVISFVMGSAAAGPLYGAFRLRRCL